nr:hypothetical protein [Shewanella septentrionalis]
MGLPASGKTTFLAALWHLVESKEVDSLLTLHGFSGDFAYLNRISEAWRSFAPVPRTSQGGETNISLQLINSQTEQKCKVMFPDLAGETFDSQVEHRVVRADFVNRFNQETGILFFINSDVKEDSLSIKELNERLQGIESDAKVPTQPAQEWAPKFIPEQVKVVQLLSDLVTYPFEPCKRRLAVLISAWDLVTPVTLSPSEWLMNNMPLVHQFLEANTDYFVYQVYGVSAQGLDFSNDTAVESAADLVPSRRIKITNQDGEGHDLTSPLIWLMSAEL